MDNRKRKGASLRRQVGAALFTAGFVMVMLLAYAPPVKAVNVSIAASVGATCTSCGAKTSGAMAVTKGDTIILVATYADGISSTKVVPTVQIVVDTGSDVTFNQIIDKSFSTPAGGGSTCAATQCIDTSIWSGTATATDAADTFIVDASSAVGNIVFGVFDVTGISASASGTSFNECTTGSCLTAITATTNQANTVGFGTFSIYGFGCGAGATCGWSSGTGYTDQFSLNGAGGIGTSLTVTGTTNYPVNKANSAVSYFELVGATFALPTSQSTSTSTINGQCIGSCTNSANSTFFKLTQTTFSFYKGQNVATGATIDNVTMKIKSVNINANTGTLNVAVYMPATATSPASANNLWTQTPGSPYAVTLVNGSVSNNVFVHLNPGSQICANCFYAVGFQAATTASTHAIGSGVYVYENSDVGPTEYQYNVGSSTPPATFFSSTTKTPRDFMYIHSTFTVATISSTITTTVSGTISSTVTVTSTTLDEALAINGSTNYAIALLMIVGPGMLLGGGTLILTKGQAGFGGFSIAFVVGLAIGTGLGVQAGLVTGAFEALAGIAMVFMLVMTFVTLRSGG